jgi:predicted ATP-grasp superfamily ATP-dependent carboligase
MPALPSAIVLGIEEISAGLTVVRELGERGVRVHGIAKWRTPALYSRWLAKSYLVPSFEAVPVELINRIAADEGPCFLLSTSESDSVLARRAADDGRLRNVRVLLPTSDLLRLVNDKTATYRIAAEVGVPLAKTWHPQTMGEAGAPPSHLTYPCVVKFADPVGVTPLLHRHALPVFKAKYCYDRDELIGFLLPYGRVGVLPLVQSFCPGQGLVHTLFMHEGRALVRFAHVRVAEWPPEGGVSAVARSLPATDNDTLLQKSEALLRRIGWDGGAQVEYRYEPTTRDTAFMEINGGRFWATLALNYHAGVPFGWFTYAVLGLNKPVIVKPYRTGIECRSVDLELRRLYLLLFRSDRLQNRELRFNPLLEIVWFLMRFFKFNTRYYLFSLRDPMPFVADTILKIWRLLRGRSPVDDIVARELAGASRTPDADT